MPSLRERQFSAKQRKQLAKNGAAMPDGGYPIANAGDLDNAVKAIGRGKGDHAAIKAHIVKRAKALGLTKSLPADWKESLAAVTTEARVQGSTDQALSAIRQQFGELYPDKQNPMGQWEFGPYVRDVFMDDGYLVCEKDGTCWKVTFTQGEGAEYSYAAPADWQEVYLTYADVPAEGTTAAEAKRTWAPAPKTHTRYFRETLDLRETTLDKTEFVVRGATLIRPGFSANTDKAGRPRYYPPETLKASVGLFEGARMFRNHPSRSAEKDLPERDVRDISGWIEKARVGADGQLIGDVHVVGESREWLWPLILETKLKPDLVELSINALGVSKIGEAQGKAAVVVESLVAINSVDVVTTGAAGGSFAGALLAGRDAGADLTRGLLGAMAFDEWRSARPEFVAKLKGEWKTVRESDALKEARTNADKLSTQLAEAQKQHRAVEAELAVLRRGETADRLLSESGMPFELRKKVRPLLLAATTDAAMQEALKAENEKWKLAPKPPVKVEGAGQRAGAQPITPVKQVNPAVGLMGISEAILAQPQESGEAYRLRRLQEQQGQ